MQDETRGYVHIEIAYGIVGVEAAGMGIEAVPTTFEIERELVGMLRTIRHFTAIFHLEIERKGRQELLRCDSVEVGHHTVVVEDGELLSGEADGQIEVVLLAAGVGGIGRGTLLPHTCSSGTAVVAVGDVKAVHLVELVGDGV